MRSAKKILRACVSLAILALLLCASLISLSAQEAQMPTLPDDGWSDFAKVIPDEVEESLEGDPWDNEDEFAQAVMQMSSGEYLASVVLDVFGVEMRSTLGFFLGLCALVTVAAVFGAIGGGSENPSLVATLRFCSVGALISYVIFVQIRHFELLDDFFSKLGGIFAGMIPVSATIWAMGGNVSTASVGAA